MTTEATRLQERVVAETEKSISNGKNVMVDAPTGAGKSRTFSRIAENGVRKGERTLILSHRKNLARQALRNVGKWASSDISTSLGIDGNLDQSGQVVSSTIQTANLHLDKIEHYDRAVIDEGHHAIKGNGDYEDLIGALKKANPDIALVTVSATFPEERSKMISDFEKADVHSITFEEAIQARLVDLPHMAAPSELLANNRTIGDMVSEARGRNKSADIEGVGAAIRKALPENWVETQAWHYSKNFSERQTLSFFDSVKDAEAFAKEVKEFGLEIETLHSGRKAADNERALERFERGELMGIASVDMISEGFDVDAKGLFIGKLTTSKEEFRQIIGRGSRSYGEDKEQKALLVDLGASTHLHGDIGAQAAANNLRKSIEGKSRSPELAPESERARSIWKPIAGTKSFAAPIGDDVIYATPTDNGYIAMRSTANRKGRTLTLLEIEGQKRGQPSRDAFLSWSTQALRQSERKLARIISAEGGVDAVIAADWERNAPSVQRNIEMLAAMPPAHLQAQMIQNQGMGR